MPRACHLWQAELAERAIFIHGQVSLLHMSFAFERTAFLAQACQEHAFSVPLVLTRALTRCLARKKALRGDAQLPESLLHWTNTVPSLALSRTSWPVTRGIRGAQARATTSSIPPKSKADGGNCCEIPGEDLG
eukprot:964711-Amphidinium_carterae.1